MMTAKDEEAAIRRAVTLANARELCTKWAYWCYYGRHGDTGGRPPILNTGGIEKRYKAPPQWHPEEPRIPEADENAGLAVQKAYIYLPEKPYRAILRAEFCLKPWLVPLKEGEVEVYVARKARVSVGSYGVTLDRALLALANRMKRMGLWRE